MNTFLKSVFVGLLIMASSFATQAQEKLAYVNTEQVMLGMAAFKQAETQLQTFSAQKEEELNRRVQTYQTAIQDLQQKIESGGITELQRQQKVQEISQMEQDIQQFRVKAEYDVSAKQEEYLAPIRQQVYDAVQTVSSENGYTFVFDLSAGILLSYPPEGDITALVQAKLP